MVFSLWVDRIRSVLEIENLSYVSNSKIIHSLSQGVSLLKRNTEILVQVDQVNSESYSDQSLCLQVHYKNLGLGPLGPSIENPDHIAGFKNLIRICLIRCHEPPQFKPNIHAWTNVLSVWQNYARTGYTQAWNCGA